MPNSNYEYFSSAIENEFLKMRNRGCEISAKMHNAENGDLYGLDFFFFGIVDKSCFLIDGIKACIKEKNLTVLGILLRAQIDNCLRAFAMSIVTDTNDIAMKVLEGKSLRNLFDKDGKKMTDAYLRTKISTVDSKIEQLYISACEDVHFSKKGMLHTLELKNKSGALNINIGKIRDSDLDSIIEGYSAFVYCTEFLYEKILLSWVGCKEKRQKQKDNLK